MAIPNRVRVIREKCAVQFLDEVLLPQLSVYGDIEKDELIKLIILHRGECYALYPSDLGSDFSLIQELDRYLMIHTIRPENHNIDRIALLNKAFDFISELLEKYPEDFYPL